MAGVYAKFPAMAVKLKGETEATKPSSDLYLIKLRVVPGSSLIGWYFKSSLPKKALKRKKSTSSAAESISACNLESTVCMKEEKESNFCKKLENPEP